MGERRKGRKGAWFGFSLTDRAKSWIERGISHPLNLVLRSLYN
ncbi:MAG: hypothetical protein AAGA60_12580 [Cyanobacteria bacterium P01_E01_bin.42]